MTVFMKIDKIVTLSLNPALDITLWVDGLDKEYNDVTNEQHEAAGKAVNVARVLKAFGCDSKTVLLAGRGNSGKYFARLDEDEIDYQTVFVNGDIRENISIVKPGAPLIRLARPGFFAAPEALEDIKKHLAGCVTQGTLVVAAGKNPRGVTPAVFAELCEYIEKLGGSLAIDTSSLKEAELCALKPWVIKPNIEELEYITDETLDRKEKIFAVFKRFHAKGVRHILLSMGGDGLYYSGMAKGENGAERYSVMLASVPSVAVKSTVGAGDSSLSGFLLACKSGCAIKECVRVAASFGTASVMLDGTNPPRMEELKEIYPQVRVSEINI